MTRRVCILALAPVAALAGCDQRRIACTTGTLKVCFGTEVSYTDVGSDKTRISIRIQDLQGTIPDDNTAWSQLLLIRVYRNMNPSLGFPNGGTVTPTWDSTVQTLGPGPAGSGWMNTGVNSPSFVSEWMPTGGISGSHLGYVAGRDQTYNEANAIGAGLRTYSGPGRAPGWVTFSFVANHHIAPGDVGIQLMAWTSDKPPTVAAPQYVGCQLVNGGGPIETACATRPYDLH